MSAESSSTAQLPCAGRASHGQMPHRPLHSQHRDQPTLAFARGMGVQAGCARSDERGRHALGPKDSRWTHAGDLGPHMVHIRMLDWLQTASAAGAARARMHSPRARIAIQSYRSPDVYRRSIVHVLDLVRKSGIASRVPRRAADDGRDDLSHC
jgi:hypothetical protein